MVGAFFESSVLFGFLAVTCLLLLKAEATHPETSTEFSVLDYGAVGDGETNDHQSNSWSLAIPAEHVTESPANLLIELLHRRPSRLCRLIFLVAPSTGSIGIVPLNFLAFFLRCLQVVVSDDRGDPCRSGNNVQPCSHLEKLGRSTFLLSLLLLQVELSTSTSSLYSPPPPSEVPNFPSHPPLSLAGDVARPLSPTGSGRPDFPPTGPSTNFKAEGSDVAVGTWNSSAVSEPDGLELSSNSSDIVSYGVSSGTPDIDVNGSSDSNSTTVDSPRAPDDSSSSGNTSDESAVDSTSNSTSADTPSNNANSSDTSESPTQASENSTSSYTPANNSSSSSDTSDSSADSAQAPEKSTSADTPPNNSSSSSDASDSSPLTSENSTSSYTPANNSSSPSDTSGSSADSTQAQENSTSADTTPNNSSSSSDASDSSTQTSGNSTSSYTPANSSSSPSNSDTSGSSADSAQAPENSTSADTPPNNSSSSSDASDSSPQTSGNSTSSYTPANNSSTSSPSNSDTSGSSADSTQAPENFTSADTTPNNSSSSTDASNSSTQISGNSTSAFTPPNNSSSSSDTSGSSTDSTQNSTSAYSPPNNSSSSSDTSDSSPQTSENSTSAAPPPNNCSSSDTSGSSAQAPDNSTSAYTPSNNSSSSSDTSGSSAQASGNSTSAYTPPNNSSSSSDTSGSSTQAPDNSTSAYTPSNNSSSSSDTSGSSAQAPDNSTSGYTPPNNTSSSSDTSGSSAQAPDNSTSAYTPPNNSSSSSDTSGSSTQAPDNSTSAYTPPNNSSSSSDTSGSTQAPDNSTCPYTARDISSSSANVSDSSPDVPGNCSNATIPSGTGDMNSTGSSANSTSNSTTAGTISMYEFGVLDYGAVGDGETDDTEAFADAWSAACAVNEDYVYVLAPSAYTFLLYPITFRGPCFPHIILKVDGIIIAPSNPAIWSDSSIANHWLKFSQVSMTVQGNGTFDGHGQIWWKNSCKTNSKNPCISGPTALAFFTCTKVTVKDISIINAQQMHLAFHTTSLIEVNSINISAPGDSPNTDGIHLQIATDVVIENSFIGTGDDCISIQSGSANVIIKDTTCGPGHGISVGGLGKSHTLATVSNITVQDSVFTNTTNGVRIKSWQGSFGHAENITYQNLQMNNVGNPILIDQYYCDTASSGSCHNFTSNVRISRITYKNITGTSATKKAITFACSETVACRDITLQDVYLIQTSGLPVTSFCTNAFGFSDNNVIPKSCLQPSS